MYFFTEVSARKDKVYRLNVIEADVALLPVSGTYVMGADASLQSISPSDGSVSQKG